MKKEEFIEKARLIHGDKYDYSLVDYKNNKTKIEIICPIHGVFFQKPNGHLSRKNGCPKCVGKNKTTEEFIEKAKLIHGDKYDYSLVDYKNRRTKIKIICPIHGTFEQFPNDHLNGSGCPECSGVKHYTTKEFIEKARLIHGDKYDYSLVDYKNSSTKIKIICKKCGLTFEIIPTEHIRGSGCHFCYKKGEKFASFFLSKKGVLFKEQYGFDDLKSDKNKKLLFDFYLPDYNTLLEIDGDAHYKPIRFGGITYEEAMENFKQQKIRDEVKNNYCLKNNIKLLRVKYLNGNILELKKNLDKIIDALNS